MLGARRKYGSDDLYSDYFKLLIGKADVWRDPGFSKDDEIVRNFMQKKIESRCTRCLRLPRQLQSSV